MFVQCFESFIVRNELKPIKIGDKNNNVKKLQEYLTQLGFPLNRFGIDSKFGYETLGQTKSLFNLVKKIPSLNKYKTNITDSIPVEAQENIINIVNDEKSKKIINDYYNDLYKKISDTDIIAKDLIVKNIDNPEDFIKKTIEISKKLKINPNWLIALMYKESGLKPDAVNPDGNATGLIQFMPKTAKYLGTNVGALKNMSAIEQLDYVYKYFQKYTGQIDDFADLYAINFYPIMLNKDSDYVIGSEKNKRWVRKIARQNKAIDLNKDEEISYNEFKEYVYKNIPNDWKNKLTI